MGKPQGERMSRYTPDLYERAFALHESGKTWSEVAIELSTPDWKCNPDTLRKARRQSGSTLTTGATPLERVEVRNAKESASRHKKEADDLLKALAETKAQLEAALHVKQGVKPAVIKPTRQGRLEATAFIVASDWHVEEIVESAKVNGINEFNLEIADSRITHFWNNAIRLIEIAKTHTHITEIVVLLLGDFISGDIHDELRENTSLRPSKAIKWVQARLLGGLNLMLSKTSEPIKVVCHSGNHARTTKKVHISTEAGHSWEDFMYHNLSLWYEDNPRVQFVIPEGYHGYINVYGHMVRTHHGHAVMYQGGIGGLTIPANRMIKEWNEITYAVLDVFGHHHRMFNGGNFIVNDSLIGYTPYGLFKGIRPSKKARQKFFLFTTQGEVVGEYPIFLEEVK